MRWSVELITMDVSVSVPDDRMISCVSCAVNSITNDFNVIVALVAVIRAVDLDVLPSCSVEEVELTD